MCKGDSSHKKFVKKSWGIGSFGWLFLEHFDFFHGTYIYWVKILGFACLGVVHKLRLQKEGCRYVVQKCQFFVNVYKVEDVNGGG